MYIILINQHAYIISMTILMTTGMSSVNSRLQVLGEGGGIIYLGVDLMHFLNVFCVLGAFREVFGILGRGGGNPPGDN